MLIAKDINKTKKIGNIFFILFVVFCIQYTELKIDVIKASELFLLLLTPYVFNKKLNKWILYLFFVFTAWFLISILFNPFRSFYLLEAVSVLKKPYLISLGRYLELVSCLNLAAFVIHFFKNKPRYLIINYIKYIYNLNFILLLFHLVLYYFHINNIIETSFVYWIDRLRAGFGEGGPYGLMLSFTYCISFFYKSKYHFYSRLVIILVIVFLARSKAGIVLILVWYAIYYEKKIRYKIKNLNIILIVISSFLILVALTKLGYRYLDDIENIKREVKERPNDINLTMGRIAGFFIFPKMVYDYPIFGIGLGNYPLMRNNPVYLGIIPHSPAGKTDAHGYGGLIQLLVDGGLFIFLSFCTIIFNLFKKLKRHSNYLIKFLFIFLFFFIFGVQIYFLYPWVLLAFIIVLSNKKNIPND